jgi:plasmid stability protein
MVQLRNVPDELHRRLKARAALEGLSLSDYLLREIRQSAEAPTIEELRQRVASRAPVELPVPPVQLLRQERQIRDRRGRQRHS